MPIDSDELDKTLQRVLEDTKHEAIRRLEKELDAAAHGNLELVLDTLETLLKAFNAATAPELSPTGGGGTGLARLANLAAGLAGGGLNVGQPEASGGLRYSITQQLVRQFDQQQQAERKR